MRIKSIISLAVIFLLLFGLAGCQTADTDSGNGTAANIQLEKPSSLSDMIPFLDSGDLMIAGPVITDQIYLPLEDSEADAIRKSLSELSLENFTDEEPVTASDRALVLTSQAEETVGVWFHLDDQFHVVLMQDDQPNRGLVGHKEAFDYPAFNQLRSGVMGDMSDSALNMRVEELSGGESQILMRSSSYLIQNVFEDSIAQNEPAEDDPDYLIRYVLGDHEYELDPATGLFRSNQAEGVFALDQTMLSHVLRESNMSSYAK